MANWHLFRDTYGIETAINLDSVCYLIPERLSNGAVGTIFGLPGGYRISVRLSMDEVLKIALKGAGS